MPVIYHLSLLEGKLHDGKDLCFAHEYIPST